MPKLAGILISIIGAVFVLGGASLACAQETGPSSANASAETGWVIKNYDTTVDVAKDADFVVTEKIAVDFGSLQKHGIYRFIPLKYNDNAGQNYQLRFKLLSVTDGANHPINYELSGWNTKNIKIGDADRTISGKQTYIIKYQIKRGIRFLETDELYWNATGNEWGVPIEMAEVTVNYPAGTTEIKTKCFVGASGSTNQQCTAGAQGNTATFGALNLSAYEGLTIVAGAPAGTLTKPSTVTQIAMTLADNLSYLVLLLSLIAFIYIWYIGGREPSGKNTVAPEFAPPDNLSPSMMGVLKDERADMIDLSVGIIHLASRGSMTIKETETKKLLGKSKDYEFIKKASKAPDSQFDKELLEAIFGGSNTKKLSELKNKFYFHIPELKRLVFDDVLKKGYFNGNPTTKKASAIALGIIIPTGLMFLSAFISGSIVSAFISVILLVPFAIWFGLSMSQKTPAGVEALRQVRGFRMFIYTAERYRAKFEEDTNMFTRFLPYAMVFGLTHKWAKAFKGLDVRPPDWYSGHSTFNTLLFANLMNDVSRDMNSTMVSSPHSQSSGSSGFGGGFSGGGFGGGGGGSW